MSDPNLSGLPIRISMKVLDSDLIRDGIAEPVGEFNDPGAWVPPWVEAGTLKASAFLGKLVNDELVREVLLAATKNYQFKISDFQDWVDHMWSWDFWEVYGEKWTVTFPPVLPRGHLNDPPIQGVKAYSIAPQYREAILHLCAGERLGKMWPRLVHGAVISYLRTKTHPEGPSFEPAFIPRLYGIMEGGLDGYHPIPRARAGDLILMNPDETKRSVLARQKDPDVKSFLEKNWANVERALRNRLGYRRRRTLTATEEAKVDWLFRRHVRRESFESIADREGMSPYAVENAVKRLRRDLDLQLKNTVRCLDHKERPPRLYE